VSTHVPTGCEAIDEAVRRWPRAGCGDPDIRAARLGKTNLALSAAVEVAAKGRSSLYIDTEGLSADRMQQVAGARADRTDDTIEDPAGRIIISDALDYEQQEQAVQDAADLAAELDLIVLDSATGFYRLERTAQEEGEPSATWPARSPTSSRWPANTTWRSVSRTRCSRTPTATGAGRSGVTR